MPFTSRTVAAAVALAISCFIIANTVIRSQPISIIIEDQTSIIVYTPAVYQEREVLAVAISSFVAGISAIYLYLEISKKPLMEPERQVPTREHVVGPTPRLGDLETVSTALKILRGPRRKILEIIVDKKGEILQKDLYLETGFSKAKISRTLKELELRNIIQRKQYGSTKKIILSDWMKKNMTSS
jgi:uncharacterized membrane protein